MRRRLALFLVILALACPAFAVVTWPAYENNTRTMGVVTDLLTSTDYALIQIKTPQGTYVQYQCANAHALGCDLIHRGDTVLFSGHVESIIQLGCAPDGPHPVLVPNAVYSCLLVNGSWSCTLLTP